MPVKFKKAIASKAIRDAAAGEKYDLTDDSGVGLVLRAAPRGAHYIVRFMYKGYFKRLKIGPASLVPLDVALTIARLAQNMTTRDYTCPTPAWVQQQLEVYRVVPKAPEPEPEPVPSFPSHGLPSLAPSPKWTFDQARDKYLADVKRTLRPATYTDRRGMLNTKELAHLAGRPVNGITRSEIATIVVEIFRSGRERYAGKLAEVIRPMWSWLASEHQCCDSGMALDESVMTGLKPPTATNDEGQDEDTYLPLPAELGRLLAIIRARVVNATTSDAALLLLFTSQRRRTIVTARRTDFIEEDGVIVWQIPPRFRKKGRGKKRAHELPLPGEAATMVRRRLAKAVAAEAESPWLFPGLRPRKAGDAVGHLHADSLTHTFADLPGITMAPHDTRRGFTTHLEDIMGLDQRVLKTVLDHSEGKESNDVTDVSYSKARRLKLKAMILDAWTAFLVDQASKIELEDLAAIKKAITAARVERARLSAKKKRVYAPRPGRKKAA